MSCKYRVLLQGSLAEGALLQDSCILDVALLCWTLRGIKHWNVCIVAGGPSLSAALSCCVLSDLLGCRPAIGMRLMVCEMRCLAYCEAVLP